MDETTFQTKLRDLIAEIETLPASQQTALKELAAKTSATHQELAVAAKTVNETFDYLRLQLKYMVFDLEATRRENGYLRKMLEARPPHRDFEEGEDQQ